MTTPARELFDLIVRVETMLWNHCDDTLRKRTGLPLGRLEVLRAIGEIENCRVNDIAVRLQITVGAVSKLVDRLEASGHCRRQPNPEDRRSSVLVVTDLGGSVLAETQAVIEPLLQSAFAPANAEALSDALARVERALTQSIEQVTD
jgi:DNA-binding MarR family transcriptional regulator